MLKKICDITKEAGSMILHSPLVSVKQKTNFADFVTDRDVAVQRFLNEKCKELLPSAGFYGEEDEARTAECEYVFVIDPIDGTANFVNGLDASAVSVALLRNGQAEYGVVFNPYKNELFSAMRGGGAYLNGVPIHVTQKPLISSLADVGTSPYTRDLAKKTLRVMDGLLDICGDTRRCGSAAIAGCNVAAGRCALMFELRLCAWDFAAARLIVEEAGGVFASLDGCEQPLADTPPIAMGTHEAMEKFLSLSKAYKD